MAIRFSQHPATRNSLTKAIKANGKPNLEYHLIVDRVKDINPHKDFYKDRTFKKISFTIRDFTFSQLCDGNTRKGVIDEIIYLLTYGTGNNNTQINTENKSMNTNKKVVRLTESQLHDIIAESVSQILNEIGDTAKGQYMLGRLQGRQKKQGNIEGSRKTWDYALKQHHKAFPNQYKWGNPFKQTADDADEARELGYIDETDPELGQNLLNMNNNLGDYNHHVRRNRIGKYSKF